MQYGRDNEREIDLLGIVWECFIQWKPALICSIIIAILAGCGMYVKDLRSYNRKLAEYETNAQKAGTEDLDDKITELRAILSDEEFVTVENAVDYFGLMKGSEEKDAGLKALDLDGDKLHYVTASYIVDSSTTPAISIIGTYATMVDADALIKTLQESEPSYTEIGRVIDIAYFYPDVAAVKNDSLNTFAVSVVLPAGADEDKISGILTNYMNDAYAKVKSTVPHSLELISVSTRSAVDETFSNRILTYNDRAISYRDKLTALTKAFTDDQTKLYEYMLMQEGLADTGADGSGSDAAEAAAGGNAASADASSSSAVITPPAAPGFSKKYIALGFLGGAFLYALLVFAIYIWGDKVRSLGEVADLYMIRGIDEVHERRFDTAWKRFLYSKRVYDLRYKKTSKDISEHVAEAGRYISEYASHSELKHITLIPAYADTSADGICGRYVDTFKDSWNKKIPLAVSKNWTTEYTFEAPGDNEGIVILMHEGDTVYTVLERIAGYCHDYKATVIGAILLEG